MNSQSDLNVFFAPEGVAVVGASRDERKLGYGVLQNLLEHGYAGPVYPVNPKAEEILGRPCYASIDDVPDPVDLAVIMLPAELVPSVVEACGWRGLRGAVVISGGFREVGPEGAERERELVQIAHCYGMRLMGPNGIGVMDTVTGLNTTFVAGMPEAGDIAFVSQSGAICGGIVDWARTEGVGFSRFVSLGNQADVTETDVLGFLEDDPHTRIIAMYLEGIADGRSFMEAARRVSRRKPVIVLKVGGTDAGAQAAASHTGALAGAAHVYQAAFRQCGVLRAESVEDLFDWARAFTAYQRLPGNAVAIITNAGGPAVVAADSLERVGLRLAELTVDTRDRLQEMLARHAQVSNPVDMLGGADPATYGGAAVTTLADPNVDGVVLIHVPHAVVPAEGVALSLGKALSERADTKPVVVSWMGGASIQSARTVLRGHGLPDYTRPERATRAMGVLAERGRWLERPDRPPPVFADVDTAHVRRILDAAQQADRETLTGPEAFEIAEAYGIPVAETRLAQDPEEVVEYSGVIGYPVALKIVAPGVVHKTEVNGVVLNVQDAQSVLAAGRRLLEEVPAAARRAPRGVLVQEMVSDGWELIVGLTHDPQFGPVVMYGLGGVYVEMLEDVSFRVAPITELDAWEMIEETRSARLLRGARGRPAVNTRAVVDCLLRVSQLAVDFPEMRGLDINPLIVDDHSAVAVDVRLRHKSVAR